MGRSAEDDRDVLALPLQRPRRHVSSGSAPNRVHPPSFDPAAARKAWRQVARVRGGGPGLGVDPRQRRPSIQTLLGVVVAAGVVWGAWSLAEPDSSPDTAPVEVAQAAATQDPSPSAQPSTGVSPAFAPPARVLAPAIEPAAAPDPIPSVVSMPASSIGTFQRREPARMAPPATEDASQIAPPKPDLPSAWKEAIPMPEPEPAPPSPVALAVPHDDGARSVDAPEQAAPPPAQPAIIRRGPAVPPGSSSPSIAAFRKLPKSERDRPPIDGIGVSGIHVDRIDLGSGYDDGVCQGDNRSYSAAATKTVNVCFRAVHRRQTERVLVKWTKNGRLVRRAWIVIPAAHAYRTRAGLRLRDSYVGSWTVTVESADGVVLASNDFKVTR